MITNYRQIWVQKEVTPTSCLYYKGYLQRTHVQHLSVTDTVCTAYDYQTEPN